MAKEQMITGVDIGSNHIRIVVGQPVVSPNSEWRLRVVGAVEVPSSGIQKGIITSIEDAVSSLSAALEKAERMAGAPIESAWIGISGTHIHSDLSRGVIAVAKPDGEITAEDVERVIEAARTVSVPPNYEILHAIPRSFTVDSQHGIKDPVGMTGMRLEVDAHIIQGLSAQINNLTKCVYRTGLDIEDIVLSALAGAESVMADRQKELGAVLVNIGGTTTSVVVFDEGDIIHTAVLPLGSDHITADLAIGLRTNIDTAERVKLEYGSCTPEEMNKKDEFNLQELGGEDVEVARRYVAQIITARVEEILEKVDKELTKIDRSGRLPAGAVLIGAGSQLSGLVELAKKKLRLPAAIGKPQGVVSAIDRVNEPAFATALGLVLWGLDSGKATGGLVGGMMRNFGAVNKVTDKVKRWFKSIAV